MFNYQKIKIISCCLILLFTGIIPLFGAIKVINYEEDNQTNFDNPERGNRSGNTLERYYFKWGRDGYSQYEVLPQDAIDDIRDKFREMLNEGKKLVPRFIYMYGCETQYDAPVDRILGHIEQLGPVLRENSDLIAVVETGFIGKWGEWHYYQCNDQYDLLDLENQKKILFKLLSVLPQDRMVVLRYNRHKRQIFGTDEPLGPDSAFSGSYRARVGHHNDCFLADNTDKGTYESNSVESQKEYLSLDTRYVPQEGEVCGGDYGNCENAARDLKRMNWDFISGTAYNSWGGSCVNRMKIGYRIVLRSAELPDSVNPGGWFKGVINLQNVGWGKIYNPRGCELVFKNTASSEKFSVKLNNDPRRWCMTDSVVTASVAASIPKNVTEGTYSVYLNLPDMSDRLHDRKEYSIRLANNTVWEDATGYNSLHHTVRITSAYVPDPQLSTKNHISSDPILLNLRSTRQGSAMIFSYETKMETPFSLEVFTWTGKKVWHQLTTPEPSGIQSVTIEGLSSGVYLLKAALPYNTMPRRHTNIYKFSIVCK